MSNPEMNTAWPERAEKVLKVYKKMENKEKEIKNLKEKIKAQKKMIAYLESEYREHWGNGDFSFMYSDLCRLYAELIELYISED